MGRRMAQVADAGSAEMAELAPALRALADPTRLKIVLMLRRRELCNCHLMERLGLTQGTVSHHMGVLKKAGLVGERHDRQDARWTYYSLNRGAIGRLSAAFAGIADLAGYDPAPVECRAETK